MRTEATSVSTEVASVRREAASIRTAPASVREKEASARTWVGQPRQYISGLVSSWRQPGISLVARSFLCRPWATRPNQQKTISLKTMEESKKSLNFTINKNHVKKRTTGNRFNVKENLKEALKSKGMQISGEPKPLNGLE